MNDNGRPLLSGSYFKKLLPGIIHIPRHPRGKRAFIKTGHLGQCCCRTDGNFALLDEKILLAFESPLSDISTTVPLCVCMWQGEGDMVFM